MILRSSAWDGHDPDRVFGASANHSPCNSSHRHASACQSPSHSRQAEIVKHRLALIYDARRGGIAKMDENGQAAANKERRESRTP